MDLVRAKCFGVTHPPHVTDTDMLKEKLISKITGIDQNIEKKLMKRIIENKNKEKKKNGPKVRRYKKANRSFDRKIIPNTNNCKYRNTRGKMG